MLFQGNFHIISIIPMKDSETISGTFASASFFFANQFYN